ncbi:uncharacterized protein EV154DRAFT_545311 [Mucor mucedo]|uniref:MYND-type domain-containing protein n=1 Tax=Mucor saturninus TaxID=64648 RepID=A0A8H7RLH0_9FUNG|nr:uncharacterized protein EV154DRAFT_545311 [Mucor mucedo]KAG2211843.1 hypothetical protein INT47_004530 [Mucor saturninus]KAI7886864.1 hypothetical protein EV154DRAFT_545311 [Mucor mucedo]
MREPNLSFPSQSRAAVCITSALYDRRALDCTATLPLVNSLTHLAYLTSTSPRIREILCLDGGLERLVRILFHTSNRSDRLTLWKWTLAFQSIVNVGVRGTEHIRTKVVDAGIIPFVITILSNYSKTFDIVHGRREKDPSPTTTTPSAARTTFTAASSSSVAEVKPSASIATQTLRRSTFPYVKIDPAQRRYKRIHKDIKLPEMENVFHREEDILLCLQLLAYLSKYPHIRDIFHTSFTRNVFSVVEKFCHRLQPNSIQYWAGVIMRNACRKDETKGGIRRCANMSCGKWETQPREFAKCRRCRKAKYCSKSCQSKAWADGHRWWCVEKHATSVNEAVTTATAITTTAAPAMTTVTSSNNIESDNAETSSENRPMLMEMGL